MARSSNYVVTASARISAPAARIYSIIADYREGHPRILPKELSDLEVENGGVGAGTVFRCRLRAFGTKRTFRGAVTEPEPGRVLVETLLDDSGAVTTFTVNPGPAERESEVTISTVLPSKPGLLGAIERALSSRFFRSIYIRQLALIARVAQPS